LRTPRFILLLPAALILVAAAGCSSGSAARSGPEFDGEAALALVKIQTDFGPRVPGTNAHLQALEWMEEFLKPLAEVVQRQPFTSYNPFSGESVTSTNLIASFYPQKRRRIMLCAHWDSRPVADQEVPPVDEPIDGAVDGAAGTAIMLQMARILAEHEPVYGVDIVLFDAEDIGLAGAYPEFENWFQGSRYFASVARQTGYKPWFAILVDLVGDKEATYYREQISLDYAPDVVKKVWDLAAALGVSQFKQGGYPSSLYDDHWILNRDAGIPSIDITEQISDYPYWHTREDTFDKVSAESLAAVGKVLVGVLYPPN
jgi:hypothetical protein